MSGIEKNIGPINYEKLKWLKRSTDNTQSESNLEAVKTFFGNYNALEKVKQEAHTRLK